MDLGMVGLGKMGANMTQRLCEGDHRVVGFDRNPDAVEAVTGFAEGANDLSALVSSLTKPRIVWAMVPAGAPIQGTVEALADLLDEGDIVIDGGNSNYKETIRRGEWLAERDISFVDVGVSGGIWGLAEGYSMMVGGPEEIVTSLRPIFETLAPAPDKGWARMGQTGAGHFVKMVHNGIEYGLMQSYAEGFAIMQDKEEFGLDLAAIANVWRHGSVVRSWLLDLTAEALAENPKMEGVAPYVPDSGEGRWTVAEAIDLNVPAPVITLALMQRIDSRDELAYSDRVLSALRNKFGGHAVKREG